MPKATRKRLYLYLYTEREGGLIKPIWLPIGPTPLMRMLVATKPIRHHGQVCRLLPTGGCPVYAHSVFFRGGLVYDSGLYEFVEESYANLETYKGRKDNALPPSGAPNLVDI